MRSGSTSGNSEAIISGVPSAEALSTTTTVIGTRGRMRAQRAEAFAEQLPRSVGHDHHVECGVAAHLSRPGSGGMLMSRGRKRLGRLRPAV